MSDTTSADAALRKLGQALFEKMEHLDPMEDADWASLSDRQQQLYILAVEDLLTRERETIVSLLSQRLPIETAPKDGTCILLLEPELRPQALLPEAACGLGWDEIPAVVARWVDHYYPTQSSFEVVGGEYYHVRATAKFWMPIPPLPETKDEA